MTHEAVPDITPDELERLRRELERLRRGIRTGTDLKMVWYAVALLEEMLEEGRVLPEAIEEFEGKIKSIKDAMRKTISTVEEATGYIWVEKLGWFVDPVTKRMVALRVEDYLY